MKSKWLYEYSLKVNGTNVKSIKIVSDTFNESLKTITTWANEEMNKGNKIEFYYKGEEAVWE